ncbi:MAG: carboxymuconolactone decarboxylase family protein [archaeon]|nr:carboxymuconolactone decarboxylase family protein [archaeon]MCP8305579.1 carboxymuconolactone decarboxylase family protein [archaeon]
MIGHIPSVFFDIKEDDPEIYGIIVELDKLVWSEGKLDPKTKKLIAIGITAALRDERALTRQMEGALKMGITKEELREVFRVVMILAGMPAYTGCGSRTLLKQIMEER